MPSQAEDALYQQDIENAMQEGRASGMLEFKEKVLSHLQRMYMDPSIKRGTPRADAILEVAKEVSTAIEEDRL